MTRSKRNLFAELMEGVAALAADREGKVTLRQVEVQAQVRAGLLCGSKVLKMLASIYKIAYK